MPIKSNPPPSPSHNLPKKIKYPFMDFIKYRPTYEEAGPDVVTKLPENFEEFMKRNC